jgi:hypothetical protein
MISMDTIEGVARLLIVLRNQRPLFKYLKKVNNFRI